MPITSKNVRLDRKVALSVTSAILELTVQVGDIAGFPLSKAQLKFSCLFSKQSRYVSLQLLNAPFSERTKDPSHTCG